MAEPTLRYEDSSRGPNYGHLIVEAFQRFPDNEAFVLGNRRMTFAEAAATLSRIQQVLSDLGIERGRAVGALSVNLPEVWLAQAATYLLGARYSGLHPLGSIDDHVWTCDDAEIEVLLVHPVFAEAGKEILQRAKTVRKLLVFGDVEGVENLFDVMRRYQPQPLDPGPTIEDDAAWVQYTGGTTGRPKGVVLPHRAMVEQARAALACWELPEKPRYLVASPITHAGVLPLFPTLYRGGCVILMQKFDPHEFLATVEKERANCVLLVPTMIYALLDHTKPGEYDLSSLETILYGTASITPSRLTEALERFGPKLVQLYGQTECVGLATSLRKDEHDPVNRPELLTSCGRPVAGTQIAVLDDDGNPVPDGTVGELCIRSRAVMASYWKQPELTEKTLSDGWLRTGDMAIRDANGYLHIVDRKKDMITTGGFNVYPKEVEDVIARDPDVAAVAVVGLPDPKWGEAVTAFVVLREGAMLDEVRLQELVRTAKGPHQTPKKVFAVDSLPMTAVGKIDKKKLREMSSQLVGEDA